MCDEADEEVRAEHLSAVFALLTGKLEDAATLAVDGQCRHSDHALHGYANQIAELAKETATIAGVLAVLLGKPATGLHLN